MLVSLLVTTKWESLLKLENSKTLKKDETTYFFINDSLIYNYVLDKFLVTIKSHLFWPLFSSSFVKNPRQRNGCLRFLPRLIKK